MLKNIKVAVRLPVVVGLALAALIVFAATSLSTLDAIKIGGSEERAVAEQNILLADILPPPAYLVETQLASMQLADAIVAGDVQVAEESRVTMEQGLTAFRERHDIWQTELEGEELAQITAVRDTGFAFIDAIEDSFFPAVESGDPVAIGLAAQEIDGLFRTHRDTVNEASVHVTELGLSMTEASIDKTGSRITMLWVLLISTLVVVGTAAVLVTRSVLTPLATLRTNMDAIASGDAGGEGAHLDADRRDEFGQVASSFNVFADKLVAYSHEVAAHAAAAEARARLVADSANTAAENMNTVAVATTELAAAASEIARSAGDANRTAETAVQATDHANALMERLADSSTRIGEVVESIRGIAAQTTMLALNATIEAARAGDAGRGFAVVASEVKDLAAETGTATADIVSRVEEIQADTQAALAALSEVTTVIGEMSGSQSVIAAAVEEQASTTAEIDRSLTTAVDAINQLAQQRSDDERFTTAA